MRASSRTAATSSGLVVNEITYRRQASTPNRAWRRAIARNVARTSPSVTPAATSRSGSAEGPARSASSAARWTAACWRTSSDARWNPNAASCQRRSATSPHATRPRPSSTSACWSDASSASSASADGVAARARRGLARHRGPRPADALGDRPESLAVGLVGKPAAELADGLRQLLGVAREGALEGPVQALGRDPRGHRLHQPHRDGLVAAQQVIGLEAGGVERDVGRHPGVSVPIGADPRPEPQQHGRGGRAGPGPAGVDGERLPVGGGARPAAARVDRPVERPHVAAARPRTASRRRSRAPSGPRRAASASRPAGRPCATAA